MNVFHCSENPEYLALIRKAEQTNRERDAIDRKAGFASPLDTNCSACLRVVISAITAGINMRDWDCVAEGLDMLQHAELKIRLVEESHK